MTCEIVECCQFFQDNMKNLPKTAEYIRNKLCFGDYESCNRYRIFKESGGEDVPFDLYPDDVEAVKKVKRCIEKKKRSAEDPQCSEE